MLSSTAYLSLTSRCAEQLLLLVPARSVHATGDSSPAEESVNLEKSSPGLPQSPFSQAHTSSTPDTNPATRPASNAATANANASAALAYIGEDPRLVHQRHAAASTPTKGLTPTLHKAANGLPST